MHSTGRTVQTCRLPAPLTVSRNEAQQFPEGDIERLRLEREAAAAEAVANSAYTDSLPPNA